MNKITIHWKSPEMIPDEDSQVVILLDSGRIHTGTVRYSMVNIHTGEHQTDVSYGFSYIPWKYITGWIEFEEIDHE